MIMPSITGVCNSGIPVLFITLMYVDTGIRSLGLKRVGGVILRGRLASSRLKLAHAIQQAECRRQVPALALLGLSRLETHLCSLQRMI